METPRPHLFGLLAGLFLSAGLCFASLVLAGTWTRLHESQVINVTGSARRDVKADLVVWKASFTVQAATLLDAHKQLKADQAKVEAWLRTHMATAFTVLPVQIHEVYTSTHEDGEKVSRLTGYRLSQDIELSSPDIELVPRLAGESTDLLEQGVAFVSDSIEFIYTKAGEAKIEMMADATKDARARAEQIAAQGGRAIKELRTAHMGVVQINPRYSTATSWEGNNDTTSPDKTIVTTVTAVFSLR